MDGALDFIVIGAQKAGTTSLFEYLRRHLEIYLLSHKDAVYFSHDGEWARDWGEYLRHEFRFASPACKWGKVSPTYMVGGVYDAAIRDGEDRHDDERTVPLRIRDYLPEVRLVAILRDPV